MPSLQTVDLSPRPRTERSPLEQTVESFMAKNRENRIEQQDSDALSDIYKKYKNEGRHLDDVAFDILQRPGLSPTARVNALTQVRDMQKTNRELLKKQTSEDKKVATAKAKEEAAKVKSEKEKQSVYELYRSYMPEEEARRRSEYDSIETAKANRTFETKPKKTAPLSPYERTIQTEEAKKVIKLEEEIPKVKDSLKNLDHIEGLIKKELSGPKGFVKSFLKTESAKEAETLSFTAIDNIIKLFNPVGPIPVQKLKMIQEQFQVKASDLESTAMGKINTLRRLGEQSLARAEQRLALIKANMGKSDSPAVQQFDKDSEQLFDTLLDENSFQLKIKDKNDVDMIEGLYSKKDGKKLKPIPKAEAVKLYNQGIITNVPQ